jgi:hypothetical protein
MRALVLAAAIGLAACGPQSTLGGPLDQDLGKLNTAVERGDVEIACSQASGVVKQIAEWAATVPEKRRPQAVEAATQLSVATTPCGTTPVTSAALQTPWRPAYAKVRELSTSHTSWLTTFTYVSMIGVGIGMYLFLRKRQLSSPS